MLWLWMALCCPAILRAAISCEALPTQGDEPKVTSKSLAKWLTDRGAVRTNLLGNAALLPNIGLEVRVSDHWSVVADWTHVWWHSDVRHRYWRTYGGGISCLYWFDPLAGTTYNPSAHIGIYSQVFTYDFEFGAEGQLGRRPSYSLGTSIGYRVPATERLSLDFTVGIGYCGGVYETYVPAGGRYAWTATKNRRYFGPTKMAFSLVWSFASQAGRRLCR